METPPSGESDEPDETPTPGGSEALKEAPPPCKSGPLNKTPCPRGGGGRKRSRRWRAVVAPTLSAIKSGWNLGWRKIVSLKKSPWPLRVALGLVALELLVVELRAVAHRRKTASLRVLAPPLAALRTLVHHPEALEYVATTALPANHQLQPADLKVPRGAVGMRSYFPPLKTRVGQYLCADVAAGQRILAENLSATALVPPDPDSYLLELRLDRVPGQPVFQPKTEVTVSSTKSPSATAKGQVLHTSWETAADQKTK